MSYCPRLLTSKALEHEARLVTWIAEILEEGRTSGDEDLFPGPVESTDCAYLAYAAVKLWAHLMKGNAQWAILDVIGEGLEMFADLCRDEYLSRPTSPHGD